MPRRLGIFGGSFNPVHVGHLLVARAAMEALALDELRFTPCNLSPDKKKLMPARLRLRLLRAAVKGEKGFTVSDAEIRRGGISRSIDTLRQVLAEEGAKNKIFLLIGQDQAASFASWKDANELSRLCQVCVMTRPLAKIDKLTHKKYHFRTVHVPQYEISSTEIRERLKKNRSIRYLVPPEVSRILSK